MKSSTCFHRSQQALSVGLGEVDSPVPIPVMGTPTTFSRFTALEGCDRDSAGAFMVESQRLEMQLENMTSLVLMMCHNRKMHRAISFGVGRMDRAGSQLPSVTCKCAQHSHNFGEENIISPVAFRQYTCLGESTIFLQRGSR